MGDSTTEGERRVRESKKMCSVTRLRGLRETLEALCDDVSESQANIDLAQLALPPRSGITKLNAERA